MAGYKSYAIAVFLGILAAAKYLGYLDNDTYMALFALLTGGGIASLRAGISKVQ